MSAPGEFSARSSLYGSPSRPRNRDSAHLRPAATPSSAPFSLAGPTIIPVPSRRSEARDSGTFASDGDLQHRSQHTPGPEEPIFGLAGPLPHLVRRGMRRSSGGRPEQEPTTTREPSHEAAPMTGTQPAPQLSNTPTRHDNHPGKQPSGQSQPAPQIAVISPREDAQRGPRGADLLRRATTANVSSYGTEIQDSTRSTEASQRQHELQNEHISFHDRVRDSPRSRSPSSDGSDGTAVDMPSRIAGSTPLDVATDRTQSLVIDQAMERAARSELATNSAQRRLRGIAHPGADGHDLQDVLAGFGPRDCHSPGDYLHQRPSRRSSQPEFVNSWGPIRQRFRKPFAEFLGTMVFMVIGLCGSITHMSSAQSDNASLLMAYLAWGLGVMIAIYIAGGISGAHMNPTVSIVLAVFRGFPWQDLWKYLIAQLLGSIAASGIAYGLYRDAITEFAGSNISIAGPAFWTAPRPGLSDAAAFFNEFVATAIVSGAILAMGDDGNAPPGAGMSAFIIGLLTIALEMAFAYNTGTCLNPARDLGPRLVTWWAGFGTVPFTLSHRWFIWGPWISTVLGGLFGAFIYDAMIFVGSESPVNYPSSTLRERFSANTGMSWVKMQGKSWTGKGNDKLGDAVNKEAV